MNEIDDRRCYATIDLGNKGIAICSKPKHDSAEQHYSHRERMRWLDGEGFRQLVNADGSDPDQDGEHSVDGDPHSERDAERVPSSTTLDSLGRSGVPGAEVSALDADVQVAVSQLVAAVRAESERKLEAIPRLRERIRTVEAENKQLRKTINDAGSVIVAAVGSIGEPREWSVKRDDALSTPRYRETFLGPKRARKWRQVAEWRPESSFNAHQVAALCGIGHGAAASLLSAAAREGKAERVSKGVYRVAR